MIKNCTGKNTLKIRRVRGDLEIRFENLKGEILFLEWYQMKKPYRETYQKIENLFKELKNLIMEE